MTKKKIICPICDGKGKYMKWWGSNPKEKIICKACKGTGKIAPIKKEKT